MIRTRAVHGVTHPRVAFNAVQSFHIQRGVATKEGRTAAYVETKKYSFDEKRNQHSVAVERPSAVEISSATVKCAATESFCTAKERHERAAHVVWSYSLRKPLARNPPRRAAPPPMRGRSASGAVPECFQCFR